MIETASNRLIIPPLSIKAVGNAIIVENTDLFCQDNKTDSGLFIPEIAGDKKYAIGLVVDVGPKCEEIKLGDILVFLTANSTGMDPIPNGTAHPNRFKVVENSMSIICRIPAEQVEAEKKRLAEAATSTAA